MLEEMSVKRAIRLDVVTTASPQTVTIQEWNCTEATLISWGDGQTTIHAAANGGTVSHQYAAAGSYTIRLIVNPLAVRRIDFRTTALLPDSAYFQRCTGVTYFRWLSVGISKFDSAHISAMALTYLSIYNPLAGSIVAFDSAHIAGKALSHLYLSNFPASSVVIFDSTHIAAMPLIYVYFSNFPAESEITVAANDFAGFPAATTVALYDSLLSQAQVDAILQGLYAGLATRTAANGTINLGGNNLAPSGLLQAMCPPVDGKEYAYELVNDSCGINPTKKWATVTITA